MIDYDIFCDNTNNLVQEFNFKSLDVQFFAQKLASRYRKDECTVEIDVVGQKCKIIYHRTALLSALMLIPDSRSTSSQFTFDNLKFIESIKLYNQMREIDTMYEDLRKLVEEQSSVIETLECTTTIHHTQHLSQATTVPLRKKCIIS